MWKNSRPAEQYQFHGDTKRSSLNETHLWLDSPKRPARPWTIPTALTGVIRPGSEDRPNCSLPSSVKAKKCVVLYLHFHIHLRVVCRDYCNFTTGFIHGRTTQALRSWHAKRSSNSERARREGQYAIITCCKSWENSVTNFTSSSRIELGTSRIQDNTIKTMYV
jgi:hypothetical protein